MQDKVSATDYKISLVGAVAGLASALPLSTLSYRGTWCGPCKFDLKNNTRPLHQALGDLPVTYLYLCNGSTTEAWRSTIAEYGLTGEHLVHYNLPAAQQNAV